MMKIKALAAVALTAIAAVGASVGIASTNGGTEVLAVGNTETSGFRRIIIDENDVDKNYYVAGATMYLHYWASNHDSTVKLNIVEIEDGKKLLYADAPVAANNIQVVRMSPENEGWQWSSQFTINLTQGQEAFNGVGTIFKITGNISSTSINIGSYTSFGPKAAKLIMSSYKSCSTNIYDGAGSFDTLKTNFFDKFTKDALNAPLYNDYSYDDYVNNSESYDNLELKPTKLTVKDKISSMERTYKNVKNSRNFL